MYGAIAGDIIGSIYEFNNIKTKDFTLFDADAYYTDDTVMTVAVMKWLLGENANDLSTNVLVNIMQDFGRRDPNRGYGYRFSAWLMNDKPLPYNSWGNGSAMRASATGWISDDAAEVRRIARMSAAVTHNHKEGMNGAEATAYAILLARKGKSKAEIKSIITQEFDYDLSLTCDEIRPYYTFDESCQNTVPQAIIAFLDSDDFEDAMRNAISLGGDSDTLACITGGIAEAYYHGVPPTILSEVKKRLPKEYIDIEDEFYRRYVR